MNVLPSGKKKLRHLNVINQYFKSIPSSQISVLHVTMNCLKDMSCLKTESLQREKV